MTTISNQNPGYFTGAAEQLSKEFATQASINTQDAAQPVEVVDLKEKFVATREHFDKVMQELQFFLRLLHQYEDRFNEAMDEAEEEPVAPGQVTEGGAPAISGAAGSVASAASSGA
ncbi:hypothetical protein SC171_21420 [Pantoea cypripedii]|uniref:hypothetical protein n=1 Tax=Pantoea cypripedii TaxID=55209 RepID=UPI002FCC1387